MPWSINEPSGCQGRSRVSSARPSCHRSSTVASWHTSRAVPWRKFDGIKIHVWLISLELISEWFYLLIIMDKSWHMVNLWLILKLRLTNYWLQQWIDSWRWRICGERWNGCHKRLISVESGCLIFTCESTHCAAMVCYGCYGCHESLANRVKNCSLILAKEQTVGLWLMAYGR